jgi:hypothetical protein
MQEIKKQVLVRVPIEGELYWKFFKLGNPFLNEKKRKKKKRSRGF